MRLDHLLSREKAELETAKLRDPRSIDPGPKGRGSGKEASKTQANVNGRSKNPERKRRMQGKEAVLPSAKNSVSSSRFDEERFVGV